MTFDLKMMSPTHSGIYKRLADVIFLKIETGHNL